MTNTSPDALFRKALKHRAIKIKEVTAEGLYLIEACGGTFTVSLENAIREYRREKDPVVFETLAENLRLTIESNAALPDWGSAKNGIRLVAESTTLDLSGVLHDPVTDGV